jgi:hypothetical protein
MKSEVTIEQVLRWRLALAEAEAPPRPCGAQLLAWACPWWERYPQRFQSLVQSLATFETGVGHAMAQAGQPDTVHPVPTLIVRADIQTQANVDILCFNLHEGQLHLRFALDASVNPVEASFDVTFISISPPKPLFLAEARRLFDSEYRLNAEIPPELTEQWVSLKATDPMPFRLILHPKLTET